MLWIFLLLQQYFSFQFAAVNLLQTNGNTLPVMEHFFTIQGEGFHQGKAAYFVRLGGCDVGCTWCDVKESWDADVHLKMSTGEIAEIVSKSGAQICVITGGEPLMYDLSALASSIQQKKLKLTWKHRVHIH